jgi:hypothetical protein
MAILDNFENYFENAQKLGEKKKAVPAGIYEAEVDELNITRSDKSGARVVKLKYRITGVVSIDDGQDPEKLELNPDQLIGRSVKSSDCAQIKTDKQKFIADRWCVLASQILDKSDLEKSFQTNLIEGNGDFDGFLSDILSDLSKVISKGKKKLKVKLERKADGEYWKNKIQMPQSGEAIQ